MNTVATENQTQPAFDPKADPPPLPTKAARKKIKLADCRSEHRGDFFLVIGPDENNSADRVLYREHLSLCRIKEAWGILCGKTQEGFWKNFDLLITLRQAVRECDVQCMQLELPPVGAGRATIMEFLRQARARDAVHHGEATF